MHLKVQQTWAVVGGGGGGQGRATAPPCIFKFYQLFSLMILKTIVKFSLLKLVKIIKY